MLKKGLVVILCTITACISVLHAQSNALSEEDKKSLKGIIIEEYYKATDADWADTTKTHLPKGTVTYRIYVDLKEGYHLQAVYGVPGHDLYFRTNTRFFNENKDGGQSADQIDDRKINNDFVALDSWLTIGMATKSKFGVLKKEDTDGSFIGRATLNEKDGMITIAQPQKLLYFGLDPSFFNNVNNDGYFHTDNGSWATVGGGKSPNKESNKVLIAQLTTNGKLSFQLNIQVGTPKGNIVQYVAKDPMGSEILRDFLTYKQK